MNKYDTIESEPLAPECVATLEEAAAYALGECALSAPARLHMLKCPACRVKLAHYQAARMALPLVAPEREPPPQLRTRLLDAVAREQAAKATAEGASSAQAMPPMTNRRRGGYMPAWGLIISLATALSLLLILITWNVMLQSQLSRQSEQMAASREAWSTLIGLMNDPTVHVSQLSGSAAHGTLWSAAARDNACLMLENLPALPPGQRYQLWLNTQGQWIAAGNFQGRDGKSWFIAKPGQSFDHFTEVLVTIESAAGSAQPSTQIVVQGKL